MNIDPKSETQKPDLFERIQDAIQSHRLLHTIDSQDEDSGLSVLDMLTPLGEDSVKKGIEECESLTESVFEVVQSENLRLQKINEELVKALERWKDLNSQLHVATFGLKELTNNLIETNKKAVTPEP